MCPSCETNPINLDYGVCSGCAAMYTESLGADWKNTPTGRFLVASNQQTHQLEQRIKSEPTGFVIEAVAVPTEETNMPAAPKEAVLDEMITALVVKHHWGARRVHSFLSVGGYNPPSLRTVQRRVEAVKRQALCNA